MLRIDKFVEDIEKEFTVGQVVKLRITRIDEATSRLSASMKQAHENYEPRPNGKVKAKEDGPVADISSVEIGDSFSAEVTDVHEAQIVLALDKNGLKALLSLAALARHRSTTIYEVRTALEIGQKLSDLKVVSKNPEKGLIIVGCTPLHRDVQQALIPSFSAALRHGISASTEDHVTFESLAKGQILIGNISSQIATGYFVQLTRGIRGKVSWTELGDDYDAVQAPLQKGAEVRCLVMEFDPESKRVELSLRQSRLDPNTFDMDIRDHVVEDIEALHEGKRIRGFVRSVSDAGVFVDIGKDLTARAQIKV